MVCTLFAHVLRETRRRPIDAATRARLPETRRKLLESFWCSLVGKCRSTPVHGDTGVWTRSGGGGEDERDADRRRRTRRHRLVDTNALRHRRTAARPITLLQNELYTETIETKKASRKTRGVGVPQDALRLCREWRSVLHAHVKTSPAPDVTSKECVTLFYFFSFRFVSFRSGNLRTFR